MDLVKSAFLSLGTLLLFAPGSQAADVTTSKSFSCAANAPCTLTLTPSVTSFYIGALSCNWTNNKVNLVQVSVVKKSTKAVDFAYPFALTVDERNARGMLRNNADTVQVTSTQEVQVTLQATKAAANVGTCFMLAYPSS